MTRRTFLLSFAALFVPWKRTAKATIPVARYTEPPTVAITGGGRGRWYGVGFYETYERAMKQAENFTP